MVRQTVMERDRERLRRMTFYCFTNECLRDYILRYFGEYGENYCSNCSNCLTQFEKVEVTDWAKALIGCVRSTRQRYGASVIIDTVHGASTAKIRNYHMNENFYYGMLSKVPTYKLHKVMNYLLLHEYLAVTDDAYMIVKLTEKSRSVLEEDEPIVMKMAKDKEPEVKVKSGKARIENEAADRSVFEKLRALRMEIAREEKVPPYIVFSDKTLTYMSIIQPKTREEMLTVSGVGEYKVEKYGERFLDCLRQIQTLPEE